MAEGIVAKLLLEWGNKQNPDDEEGGFMSKLVKGSGKRLKIAQKGLKASLGMNFTMGAILKQSQVFTGTMGALFQVMGAMVDVFLMPLVPYVLPLIKTLAKTIPIIRRTSQAVIDFIAGVFKKVGDGVKTVFGWMGVDGSGVGGVIESIGKTLVGLATVAFMLKVTGVWALIKVFFKPLIAVVNIIKNKLVGMLVKFFPQLGVLLRFGLPKYLWLTFKGGLSKLFSPIIQFLVTWQKNSIAVIVKGFKSLGGWFAGVFTNSKVGQFILGFFPRLKNGIVSITKTVITNILNGIKFLLKPVTSFVQMFKTGWGKLVAALSKSKIFGGAFKGLGGLFSKAGAKSAAKFIPGLGTIATAGFAAVDTYKTFKDQGMAAGFTRAGIGVAQTGLSMAGPAGVAGVIALDLAADKIVNAVTGSTTVKVEVGEGMEATILNERTGSMQTASAMGENSKV